MSRTAKIVITCLIVILFLLSGGLGYFSFDLNSRLNSLDDDTQAFKADTSRQFDDANADIADVDSQLSFFQAETSGKFSVVQSDIDGLDNDFSEFKTDTTGKLTENQGSINQLTADLDNLGTRVGESMVNVREVYEDVIRSVVFITDGNGGGSGFIYSAGGYIVTNWHVIRNMSNIFVQMHDGTVVKATLVGSDKFSDVAVIEIKTNNTLKPLPLADSGELVSGEPIMVIGNPYEVFESVTFGIISRTKGAIPTDIGPWIVANLIQIDAAVNPGNSGGPVFNTEGKVIGIASYTHNGGEGLNYAVSSNKIARIAGAIIDDGSFTAASLPGSWRMRDMTPDKAYDRGLESSFGVLFASASGVGDVQVNDIVVAVDGVPVKEIADLISYFGEFGSVGQTVTLTVISDSGALEERSVELEEGWVYAG